jgi:hypothetical protein
MANMVLIDKVTVGSGGTAAIEFTGIPQTYTDLQIVVSGRSDTNNTGDYLLLNFNGSTSNLSSRTLGAYGPSSTFSGTESTYFINIMPAANATANTFGENSIYIPNYTSSNYKSGSIEGGFESNSSSNWFLMMTAGLWSNTSAITSVKLDLLDGNFVQYSTAYLYGVTNITSSIKASGGTITSDGSYVYHTFTSSGTFTPTTTLTADYLVVAGGGGGGSNRSGFNAGGGGGGAGGLRSAITATGGGGTLETALSLTATAYTVTIGAGGAGGVANTSPYYGADGSNSVFGSITSTAGGGGGNGADGGNNNGRAGGSGGGAGQNTASGGTGTANQGYAGGTNGGGNAGAGGGGAGAIGGSTTTSQGANGGNGVNVIITGSLVSYAGGGGGGTYGGIASIGGTGGGGNGGLPNGATGSTNTGGGGGGGGTSGGGSGAGSGGNGGSGIVIVRYAV